MHQSLITRRLIKAGACLWWGDLWALALMLKGDSLKLGLGSNWTESYSVFSHHFPPCYTSSMTSSTHVSVHSPGCLWAWCLPAGFLLEHLWLIRTSGKHPSSRFCIRNCVIMGWWYWWTKHTHEQPTGNIPVMLLQHSFRFYKDVKGNSIQTICSPQKDAI